MSQSVAVTGRMLVINCGSSSVKFQLIDLQRRRWQIKGLFENIGVDARLHIWERSGSDINTPSASDTSAPACNDTAQALQIIATRLSPQAHTINAIVHRVVHGGQRFSAPVRITQEVMAELAPLAALAPLHNPANLQGIDIASCVFAEIPQFAVFDTAFHATLPPHAYRYAVPNAWFAMGVRRYGFHGTSHQFVAGQAAQWLQRPLQDTNLITLHLGNGASITAIEKGRSVDTSMGFTPLEGLIMGSRCGDLDAGIPAFMARATGEPIETLERSLWNSSGLHGLAGSHDMRTLQARADTGDADAQLAIDMYCYRGKKYVGSYLAALGRVDAIVFTGGIGENAAPVRAKMLAGLSTLGIEIDTSRNRQPLTEVLRISSDTSQVPVLVIATNEELEMARQVAEMMAASH